MNIAQFEKIYNAVNRSGRPDVSKGLAGWQKQAKVTRGAILMAREQVNAEKEKLNIYNDEEKRRRSAELDRTLNDIIRLGREKLTAALDAVIEAKRQQFKRVALSAPTESQIRLLQALALRDDLTEGEVSEIAADMADCLQALKSLGSICRKAGLDFPTVITQEDFENQISAARQFSVDMLNTIDTPSDALDGIPTTFWIYEGKGPANAYYTPLDTPRFAAVQQNQDSENTTNDGGEKPKKKVHLDTRIKTRPVKHVTDGVDDLVFLSTRYDAKIRDIVASNPDAGLDLDHNTQSLPRGLTLTITPGEGYQGPRENND